LCSSWELAREYGVTDYDGSRPAWGAHAVDWSVLPPGFVEIFRAGARMQLEWLETLSRRTREFAAKISAA
jgi:hypothetical protein